MVHPGPSDDLIDLIIDLRQYFLEVRIDINKLKIILVALAGLLDDLLEEHLVSGDPKGGLKQFILCYFVGIGRVGLTDFSDFLVGLDEFLQEALG